MSVDERVVGGERLELVRRGDERVARELGELLRDAHGVFGVSVEARAHGRAAQGELGQVRQRPLEVRLGVPELRDVPRELLAERERNGVHQMGAAELHDASKGIRFRGERFGQALNARQESILHHARGGDVHRRREDVVRRLAAVDVVVRVDEACFAPLATEDFARAVGEHLVHVHVRLRAAARLPNDEGEFVVVLAGQNFVGRGDDGAALFRIERSKVEVDEGGGLFDERERVDQRARHALARDLEVRERALRLRAPQPVGGDVDGAEGVFLDANVGAAHRSTMLVDPPERAT